MMEKDDKLSGLKALLEQGGFKLGDAAAALRKLNKEASDKKAAEFQERKDSNKDTLLDIMSETRTKLAGYFTELLPGTHANFTVRVDKEGNVIATANDCHAAGFRDSFHITPTGDVVTGEEGAEMAKNVRPRKASKD